MVIPLLVVKHGPLLDTLFRGFQGDRDDGPLRRRKTIRSGFHGKLQGIKQGSGIPGRHLDQVVKCLLFKFHLPLAIAALTVLQGLAYNLVQVFWTQAFELKHPAAADQGFVHFKVGIFGGCTDKDEGAFFHPGKKGVLLGFIPAVDLVDKEDGASGVAFLGFSGLLDRVT